MDIPQNTQVEEQQPSQQAVDTSSVENTTPQNITKLKLVSIDPITRLHRSKQLKMERIYQNKHHLKPFLH
jgi:hypothetical protein